MNRFCILREKDCGCYLTQSRSATVTGDGEKTGQDVRVMSGGGGEGGKDRSDLEDVSPRQKGTSRVFNLQS